MISFRPMNDDEFPAYMDYFIPDYAAEIAANYRLSHEQALQQARAEINSSLPDGVNTAGNVLLCIQADIDSENGHAGYLWYKPDIALKSAFINDFHILPPYQNRGFGREALICLEKSLIAEGFRQIKLRVAGDNHAAQHVYASSGFNVTGVNMNKVLVDYPDDLT